MNTTLPPDTPYAVATEYCPTRTVSWGAIFAGTITTIALQIVLMMLGSGLGLAIYHPASDDNPIGNLSTGAVVVQGITCVISLWIGGWVAGRSTGRAGRKVGRLHGFMVWCFSTVLAIAIIVQGAGAALGGIGRLAGGGLSVAGKAAATAAGGASDGVASLAKEAASRTKSLTDSYLDEGISNRLEGKSPGEVARAKRELGFAIAHLFSSDEASMAANKQAVVTVLVNDVGMSQADARRMVDEWTSAHDRLKKDLDDAKEKAAAKAKEVAEKTAKALALFSLVAFFAFMIGMVVSIWGGSHGGACAYRRTEGSIGVE
jgi:hypothetical protein